MIRIVVLLQDAEVKALAAMCRGFQYNDAQYHLRNARNVKPDSLCEAMTSLWNALESTRRKPNNP
jgi:hypothetical protein